MNLYSRIYEAQCEAIKAKEDLIIIHGLFGMSDNWASLAKKFSKNRKVIVPDLRNHGQSPHNSAFDLEDLSGDLNDLIKKHNCKNPIILGHSLGGRIAMKYALTNPNITKSIIVVDMSMKSVRERPEHGHIIDIIRTYPLHQKTSYSEIKTDLIDRVSNIKHISIIIKNIKKTDSGFEWKVNIEPLLELFNKPAELIATDEVYENEALFIRGGNSDYVIDSDLELIEEHFPNYQLVTINGASHWVQADKPLEFIDIVLRFL